MLQPYSDLITHLIMVFYVQVAIKLIRSNETMYKAAQMELTILKRLCNSDPDNRKHCIRLLRAFEYRNHMCLVFEPMVSEGHHTAGLMALNTVVVNGV